jgi:hypothetical protein
MLAKKILSKIETENNPFENVVPKPTLSHELSNELSDAQKSSIALEGPTAPSVEVSVKSCNCKRSKCLKLYCECFANNKYCGANCACNGCSNISEHEDERLQSKE